MLRSFKIVPKIFLYSRIQSLHRLLEVNDHDEEEYSFVLTLGNRLENNSSGFTSVHFLSPMGKVLVDGLARVRLCSFALALDRLAKARWMSLLLLAKSESKSHVRLSLLEIVGGGRGDTYAFWYMTTSDFITIAFEMQ